MNFIRQNRTSEKDFLIMFSLSVLFFILVYVRTIEFSVYDDYQVIIHLVAGRYFSPNSVFDQYFQGYVGFANVIRVLTDYMGYVNWMSVLEMGLLSVGVFLYIKTLYNVARKLSTNLWFLFLIVLFGLVSFLDSYAVISFSRPSLMLCGIGVYGLLFSKNTIKRKACFYFIFLIGILLRPESGLGMFIYIAVGYLIYHLDFLSFIKKTKWVLLTVGLNLLIVSFLVKYGDNPLYKLKPEVEYKMKHGYMSEIDKSASVQDSIKYLMGVNGFIFDTEVLSADYLRSIQSKPNTSKIVKEGKTAIKKVSSLFWFYTIPVGMLLVTLFFSFYFKEYKSAIKIIALSVFTFCIVVGARMYGDMGHRQVQPVLSFYILFLLVYITEWNKRQWYLSPKVWGVMLIVMVVSLNTYVGNAKGWAGSLIKECKLAESRKGELENKFHGELIIVTLSSVYDIFNMRYGFINKNQLNNTYLMIDVFDFSMSKPYYRYLGQILEKEEFSIADIYRYFGLQNALYLEGEHRVNLIKSYMDIIYSRNIIFEKAENQLEESANIDVFRMGVMDVLDAIFEM